MHRPLFFCARRPGSPRRTRSTAVTVFVPQQLRSYTAGATHVEAQGRTVHEALANINQRCFPGIRVVDEQNRIRERMRIFVDGERVHEVSVKLKPKAEVHIFGALSGG